MLYFCNFFLYYKFKI